MNITKNGIPIAEKHNRIQLGKPYRAVANTHNLFITLYRKEEFTPVWLVMPFNKEEVKQLKREGWHVEEVWKKRE
jgi:hypothetical protein